MQPDTPVHTDLTFFTNEPGATLLDRFKKTLQDVQLFDILVGYFRISGFHQLYASFESIEKIRILVGLSVDRTTYELIETYRGQNGFDFTSHARAKKTLRRRVITEMEDSEDSQRVEEGLRRFITFLELGQLEIKVYPSADLHAKVYIARFGSDDRDFGRVITGSSNFSQSGLVAQREFNVELKDRVDVEFALEKFEELWKDAVEVTEDYVDTLHRRTWFSDHVSPYDIYLKFLYEYFREDINLDVEEDNFYLPDGFMELDYQRQAVTSARKILEAYNGVFIADVVGLGKTYIAAMLAQQLAGKILVICPPVLRSYWEDTFFDFGIRGYKVESLGKLEHIIRGGHEKFDYVILDEAHRFRNEVTQSYELLHEICFGKKVVLVSATPLNNTLRDIFSLLKLFQTPKRSTIPGVPDLEHFFKRQEKRLRDLDRNDPQYLDEVKAVSAEVRDKVLKHVMIRRTRSEIVSYFSEDMQRQGLSFPDLEEPHRIIYTFDAQIEQVFSSTIERLKDFSYARYTPLLFLKKQLSPLEAQSQRNVGGFMKGILVKRLESSFYAFQRTLSRFIRSYERFIEMYETGTIYIGKDVNIFDLLDNDDEEKLMALVEADRIQRYTADDFQDELLETLQSDLALLQAIQQDWAPVTSDPKLEQFIVELKTDPVLKKRKLLIFTESKETGEYLRKALERHFAGQVLFYSSGGGQHGVEHLSVPAAREVIKNNFDPNARYHEDDVRILTTTDVLAEGINLHRSNVVINYDLPWNPTRVLQRVGRVNRVGTEHDRVFVYNFFPTAQSDAHLGLEANVKAKIQAFHDTLGEDAKYLTDEEIVSTHELFGERLYRTLNEKETYEAEEEEGPSELKYLKRLRDIRDNEPDLFERIKGLPKKARTCRAVTATKDRLITFFRKDKLKKFFLTDGSQAHELTFFEAADLFACTPDTLRKPLPDDFFEKLTRNKDAFDLLMAGEVAHTAPRRGRSNEQYILRRLKAKEMKRFKGFTEDDEEFMAAVRQAFEDGIVPKNTSKRIKQEIEREINPLKVMAVLRANIPYSLLREAQREKNTFRSKREVILSEYLLAP